MKKKPDRILPPEDFDHIRPKEMITTAITALCLTVLVVGLTYLAVVY